MRKAPQQDWSAYEAATRQYEVERLRQLGSQQRFVLYEDLYRLISDGRRGGDWSRLNAWHWEQKIALRQRLIDAYHGLDQLHGERTASQDSD